MAQYGQQIYYVDYQWKSLRLRQKKGLYSKDADEYKNYAKFTNNNYIVWITPTEEEKRENAPTISMLNIVEIDDIP